MFRVHFGQQDGTEGPSMLYYLLVTRHVNVTTRWAINELVVTTIGITDF